MTKIKPKKIWLFIFVIYSIYFVWLHRIQKENINFWYITQFLFAYECILFALFGFPKDQHLLVKQTQVSLHLDNFVIPNRTKLHCTTLHCITLDCIIWPCITLHCITRHCTNFTANQSNSLECKAQFTTHHSSDLHWTSEK